MNIAELKKRIKSIPGVELIYNAVYGNRKVKRINEQQRELLQSEGKKLVEAIEKALSQQSVKYYLDFGSLLGMIRDKKFMDYDNDIDYSIYIGEGFSWTDLENVMQGIGLKKYRQYKYKNQIVEQTYSFGKLTVDFFSHHDDEKNSIIYWFFRDKEKKYHSLDERSVAEDRYFKVDKTKSVTINGLTVTVPVEYDAYLSSIYTKNWRIPDPNWDPKDGPDTRILEGEVGIREDFIKL